MNSFRLLILLYAMIITSLAYAVDDFNSMPPRPRPRTVEAKDRKPKTVSTANKPKKKRVGAKRKKPREPATSLVTNPVDFGPPAEAPAPDRDPASVPTSQ